MRLIERTSLLAQLQEAKGTPDIKIITGVRRSGKSKLLTAFMEWIRQTEKDANIIFIDFRLMDAEPLKEYHALHEYVEAHLLAPTIDLGGEFVTTIWREDKEGDVASGESNMASERANMATNIASESPNVASEEANIASGLPNIASGVPNIACETSNIASVKQAGAIDYLEANKRLIDSIVAPKVKQRMKPEQIRACIIEACIVEHSTEELAALLHKAPAYLRNFIIPDLITEGILLRTKPRTANGQTYITNPKYR